MIRRRELLIRTTTATAGMCALTERGSAANIPRELAKGLSQWPIRATLDPAYIDLSLDSRSISFENPTGGRGEGGKLYGHRKGRPLYVLDPREKIVLADIRGPGTIRHIWTPLFDLSPEVARSLCFEVFYEGLAEPSISVPILDFFGLPHGRMAEYYSSLASANEGRGLNCYMPMPFEQSIRIELTNRSAHYVTFFYQIDYTLEQSIPEGVGYLHATFRRENPTTERKDFVIAEGLKGPGRFLGCSVGVRVLEKGTWYGEGEVKIYRDGDDQLPTYCGTGLEDYAGSGYGLNRYYGPYTGSPIQIPLPPSPPSDTWDGPDLVSFYRWHLPDPIIYKDSLRVTIQQIGGNKLWMFQKGQEAALEAYMATHLPAGPGWARSDDKKEIVDLGTIVERRDDYCATAFVYCQHPQAVPRVDIESATRDIGLLPIELKGNTIDPRAAQEQSDQYMKQVKRYWRE